MLQPFSHASQLSAHLCKSLNPVMYTGMCEEYRLCTFCDWQKPKSVPKMHSGICLVEEEEEEEEE
jgi:hypothetical protein